MKDDKNKQDRPEAYPKPTETDIQLNNQPEYTEPEANRSTEQMTVNSDIKESQQRMKTVEDKEENK